MKIGRNVRQRSSRKESWTRVTFQVSTNQVLAHAARATALQLNKAPMVAVAARGMREGLWSELMWPLDSSLRFTITPGDPRQVRGTRFTPISHTHYFRFLRDFFYDFISLLLDGLARRCLACRAQRGPLRVLPKAMTGDARGAWATRAK